MDRFSARRGAVARGKLVRDRIVDIIQEEGKVPAYRAAKGRELQVYLWEKLQEEVGEFLHTPSCEEIADIIEVVFAICSEKGIGWSVRDAMLSRAEEKKRTGAFLGEILRAQLMEASNKLRAASQIPYDELDNGKLGEFLEIVCDLAFAMSIPFGRLEEVRAKKLGERGGFRRGFVLEKVSGRS